MHDIYTARLADILHAEVADVHPDHRVHEVLDRAHRLPAYAIALALTAGLLLIAAGLLLIAHQHHAPAQPTTRYQEA